MGILSFIRSRFNSLQQRYQAQDNARVAQYARYRMAYRGYAVRDLTGTQTPTEAKRLKFNFNRPIVNLGAAFLAAKPLAWKIDKTIDTDGELTKRAKAIWDRSGSDAALLESAVACGIYGDLPLLATANERGEALIEFLDPCICYPTFDGRDYAQLRSLDIAYETIDSADKPVYVREIYTRDGYERYDGDTLVASVTATAIPVAWCRNLSLKGEPFGMSDLDGAVELVEEYDHIASKQTRIVDYYASPNIYVKGVQKGTFKKDSTSVYFLPADGDIGFVEWKGNTPAVEDQLDRIKAAIQDVTQCPPVIFGHTEGSTTNISGVALKILYGPLLSKTQQKRAQWSPALEYVMWLCLRQETGIDLPLTAINAVWQDPMPNDDASVETSIAGQVQAEILSRRSAMSKLGVEDPDAEMQQIEKERQQMTPAPAPQPQPKTENN